MSMNVEEFVTKSVTTLDSYDTFDLESSSTPPAVTRRNNWTNPAEIEDAIVDRVLTSDDPFAEFASIMIEAIEVYDKEPTDEQIAAEIVQQEFSYITGIVTEINFKRHIQNNTEKRYLDVDTVAKIEQTTPKKIEESGIDARIIEEDGTQTDVQVKSSRSSAYDHGYDNASDEVWYPQNGGWNKLGRREK
jgi:hypothetical protein